MQNDFDTHPSGKTGDPALPENLSDLDISPLSPGQHGHARPSGLGGVKQRLLDTVRNVSRATFSDIVHVADDLPEQENTGLAFDDLEISDLPPTHHSHHVLAHLRAFLPGRQRTRAGQEAALRARRRSLHTARIMAACAIALLLLILLAGSIPALRTGVLGLIRPTPSPTAQLTYFSQQVINSGRLFIPRPALPPTNTQGLDSIPSTCPRISTLLYFATPLNPPGLGAGPVWLSGFTGPSAALDNLAPLKSSSQALWYEKLAIFIQKGFTSTITLKGAAQNGNAPILIGRGSPQHLATSLTLNLNDGSHYIPNGTWKMTSVTLAVPVSGCYALQATWDNTSWMRYFAAGS